jgi:hypothetical protein
MARVEAAHAVGDYMQPFPRGEWHICDPRRQLRSARSDSSDWIHTRRADFVALLAKVCGNAVEVLDRQSNTWERSESKDPVRENNLFCHRPPLLVANRFDPKTTRDAEAPRVD